jgi:hypothetical protein
VGAGGALTGGLKLLPPVGLRPFSVGETDAEGAVVVVVVVVLDGPPDSLPPQAVSAPIEMRAATPRPAAARRVNRLFMMLSYLRCWKTL